jgi:hypothetical protein
LGPLHGIEELPDTCENVFGYLFFQGMCSGVIRSVLMLLCWRRDVVRSVLSHRRYSVLDEAAA